MRKGGRKGRLGRVRGTGQKAGYGFKFSGLGWKFGPRCWAV